MFPLANGETVTRLRRQLVTDPYSGQQTKGDWENPDRLPIEGVAIAPSSGTDLVEPGRQGTSNTMSIYGPPNMDVKSADRIEARSGTWQVEGEVANYVNAFTGWNPGAEFRLSKVSG